MLKHEAKLSERFDHPNLVRFKKLVMNKKRGYMVVDYFRAPNLKMQLQAGGVSLQIRFSRLFEQLCQVLGYLHDLGWVHRDVKPDNILFNKASELRLIDFSLTTKAAERGVQAHGEQGKKVIQGTRTFLHFHRKRFSKRPLAAVGHLQLGDYRVRDFNRGTAVSRY